VLLLDLAREIDEDKRDEQAALGPETASKGQEATAANDAVTDPGSD
jgi:hypothetical protein